MNPTRPLTHSPHLSEAEIIFIDALGALCSNALARLRRVVAHQLTSASDEHARDTILLFEAAPTAVDGRGVRIGVDAS